ncbi:hypothetical protein HDU81_001851, partial [Chytriomyces hyalinus]
MSETQPTTIITTTVTDALREDLREYMDLSDQLKKIKKDVKILNERKTELENKICIFMVDNDIPAFKTPTGKISVCQVKSTKPLNKEYLFETMKQSSKVEENLAKELSELFFTAR